MSLSDLRITYRATTSLRPYANNARVHSKAQLKKLCQSISTYGWTNPIIIDESGTVLCGAGRLEAATMLGIDQVPTIELGHMSEAQRRAYILADNRIADQSAYSKTMLRDELRGLIGIGYDVELTGFDTIEVDTLLSIDDGAAPDDVVRLPGEKEPVVSQAGDLWVIGNHRLYVGDARDPLAYEILLAGERAQLIFTDPPYGHCQPKCTVG